MARIGALLGVAAVSAAACQLVAGLGGDFAAAPHQDGGEEDGGAGAGGSGPVGCVAATYPDPPGLDDSPSSPEIVLALRTIDLGESAAVPPGYDLDHACTCFADAGPSCVSKQPHCDAPGGIDSASAQFFSLIQFAVGAGNFSSSSFSAKVEKGTWTLLIRIRGYNGKLDDPAVDVAIFPSSGIDPGPVWNGNDAWGVSVQSVSDGDLEQPLYPSAGAYVSQGTLVAALPSVLMKLGGEEDTITLHLTGGVLTGHLVSGPGGWTMTGGVLAARWKDKDLFEALSSYRDGNGKPICTDSAISYATAKTTLCKGLDILADPSGARSLPCDALSIGLGFTAQPAKLGAIEATAMPTPGCPPETDPATDSCGE